MIKVRNLFLDAKYALLWMSVCFALSFIIGFKTVDSVLAALKSEMPQPANGGWLRTLLNPEIVYRKSEIKDPKLLKATLQLFLGNAITAAELIYCGGLIVFAPSLFMFVNGWFCGALLERAGFQLFLHRVAPHGIVELPVLLSMSSIATLLSIRFYRSVTRTKLHGLINLIKEASFTYAACLPFLLISAFLENYGTRVLWG